MVFACCLAKRARKWKTRNENHYWHQWSPSVLSHWWDLCSMGLSRGGIFLWGYLSHHQGTRDGLLQWLLTLYFCRQYDAVQYNKNICVKPSGRLLSQDWGADMQCGNITDKCCVFLETLWWKHTSSVNIQITMTQLMVIRVSMHPEKSWIISWIF